MYQVLDQSKGQNSVWLENNLIAFQTSVALSIY